MNKTTLDVLQITDMIHAGAFDADIDQLSTAVNMRLQDLGKLPRTVSPAQPAPMAASTTWASSPSKKLTIGDLSVGDRVKFNSDCGTRYMIGQTGVIKSKRRTKVVVTLDDPIGRFARKKADGTVYSAPVVAPVGILEKV